MEPEIGPRTLGENTGRIARRLQRMALNMAQALDGLNSDKPFPLPEELNLNQLFAPDGSIIGNDTSPPNSLQALLSRLGGKPAPR